jgi:hypothetical protein
MRRAQSYKNLFDPATGFMRARMEGAWFTPFDPSEVNFNYTEANAWQYSFFAPQDVEGLMRLHGGREAFARKLDALFAADSRLAGNQQADITGLVGQYAHGNEPSHHIAYLYDMAGQPWKTQALVRRLCDTMYADAPDGLAGNEDCGQMSAWFVLSALGFYPVAPGSNRYAIGAPLFPKATIRLENGRTFTIVADGVSPTATYIQGAELNGAPYANAYLDHAAIAAGGVLRFRMGERPNEAWGVGPDAGGATAIRDAAVVPVPFVSAGATLFRGATRVALGTAEPVAEVRYALDLGDGRLDWRRYDGPFEVDRTVTLRAVAVGRDGAASEPLTASLHRMPEGRSIRLSARYSNQYSAGGDEALVDGLRGGPSWRLGRWQGYQGKDLVVDVDLGRPTPMRRLAMGFIQDTGSWVLMPRRVTFAVSDDGVTYRDVGTVENDVPDREYRIVTKDFAVALAPHTARYVRVSVVTYGPLPPWHAGAGEPAFFFADELVVE